MKQTKKNHKFFFCVCTHTHTHIHIFTYNSRIIFETVIFTLSQLCVCVFVANSNKMSSHLVNHFSIENNRDKHSQCALVTKIIITFHTDDTFGLTSQQHGTEKEEESSVNNNNNNSQQQPATVEIRLSYYAFFRLLIARVHDSFSSV